MMAEIDCHWGNLLVLPLLAVCELGCMDETCWRIGWPLNAEDQEL